MNILNRLLLQSILPKEGSFEDLIVIEDINKKISFTQDEIKEYNLKTKEDGTVSWKEEIDSKEIEFTEMEKILIKKELNKLNEAKKLQANMLDLYKTFNS